jgi:hypothetical protein
MNKERASEVCKWSVQVERARVLVFPYGQKLVTWQCPDYTDLMTVLYRCTVRYTDPLCTSVM